MHLSLLFAAISNGSHARIAYLTVLCACLGVSVGIGYYFSRRQTNAKSFFLGKGDMPGWLVGFSITANVISAMTFLATPGFSFKHDYRWVVQGFSFFLMAIFAMVVLVPFYRRANTPSGYAFLEQRFGTWSRIYAAVGFLLFNALRLGVVLYVTSLSLEVMFGIPAMWLILILGIVATIYTMMGGFEAVVWTEFFQAVVLVIGALVLVPVALSAVSGGLDTVFALARPAGKMSLGSTELTLSGKTIWVMALASLFYTASDFATRQDYIQRYRAARTANQARVALLIAAVTIVPIWIYFNFLGTVLWTYYQLNPDEIVTAFAARAPEKIVPYFMATHLSIGLNGLVLSAIVMASLSTLAPILNACAATWVGDFHLRFLFPGANEKQQLSLSRRTTQTMGVIMIFLALLIHLLRTQTLQDLQATGQMLFSAGIFGLFMIGLFRFRIGRRAALYAVVSVIALVAVWFTAQTQAWVSWLPDLFWVPVLSNLGLPALAFIFARVLKDTSIPAPVSPAESATRSA